MNYSGHNDETTPRAREVLSAFPSFLVPIFQNPHTSISRLLPRGKNYLFFSFFGPGDSRRARMEGEEENGLLSPPQK